MAATVTEIQGRKWSASSAPDKATRVFKIIPDTLGSAASTTYTGLPTYGTAHPSLSGLYVSYISFDEGTDAEKSFIVATVEYSRRTDETSGEGESAFSYAVDEWGWDNGTEEKELTTDADGVAVMNSAGDPFDSVPNVSSMAPVFTKVMRFKARQSNAMSFSCKVNAADVAIGGYSFPPRSLLCTVAEKRIVGSTDWKYQYTVTLKYKTNKVKVAGASSATDIGWDVAVTDAGMREKDANGKLKIIRQIDAETGNSCTVTSPELLNGSGGRVARSGQSNPVPYNFRFAAYEAASFPSWFYSEPN